MEVSGQFHAMAALLLGSEPLVPIGQEVEWAPEPNLDSMAGRKNIAVPTDNRTPVVQSIAYSLFT
jgi:hypothetical protein